MKTREEIQEEINRLGCIVSENKGVDSYAAACRIRALSWVLQETKEDPLTNIELKQLRAIMREHREKK